MNTLWAIQIEPLGGRSAPWIDYRTVRRTQREAWAVFNEGVTVERKPGGAVQCVRVKLEAIK